MDLVSFVPGINTTGYEAQLSTASSVIPQEPEKRRVARGAVGSMVDEATDSRQLAREGN
jgi:hypothetical protein